MTFKILHYGRIFNDAPSGLKIQVYSEGEMK